MAVVEISDAVEVVVVLLVGVVVVKTIEVELVESTVVCAKFIVLVSVMVSSVGDISVAGTSVFLVCGDTKLLVSPLASVSSLSAARPGLPR